MAELEGKGSWPPSPKAEMTCYLPARHRPELVIEDCYPGCFFLMSVGITQSSKPQASLGSG